MDGALTGIIRTGSRFGVQKEMLPAPALAGAQRRERVGLRRAP